MAFDPIKFLNQQANFRQQATLLGINGAPVPETYTSLGYNSQFGKQVLQSAKGQQNVQVTLIRRNTPYGLGAKPLTDGQGVIF